MPIFDELRENEFMEDPEERKAAALERSERRSKKRAPRERKTSISAGSFTWQLRILKAVLFVLTLAVVAFVIYQGILLFIP